MGIPFTGAKIFFGGYEVQAQFNQVELNYESEALDETAFGDTTRKMRGGLKVARMSGGGFYKAATGQVDPVFFDSIDLTDAVVMVGPEALTEGSTSTGFLYGFKSDLLRYQPVGGRVGELQAFTISAEGRGV